MRRKKILMACGNYWTSPFQVGSHHIARGFVQQGWEVCFISDPISPLHLLAGVTPELKERYRIHSMGGFYDNSFGDGFKNLLWTYIPLALFTPHNKPILKSGYIHNNWHKFTCPNVIKKVSAQGFGEIDLLYIDSVVQGFWLDEIKYKKAVFRVADKITGFSKSTDAVRGLERKIAQKADVVAYTAHSLKDYVCEMEPKKTMHLPNGVNFEHFYYGSRTMPEDMKNIPKPIAIYVGAMDDWFDYELVNVAATELPKVSFVLIGPDKMARDRLRPLPNIYLLGRKNYADLPQYLYNADVGIIPFDVKNHKDLVNCINPLKLYEYMACGLPVVSVEWDELKFLNSPAKLCASYDDFINSIKGILMNDDVSLNKINLIFFSKKRRWNNYAKLLIETLCY